MTTNQTVTDRTPAEPLNDNVRALLRRAAAKLDHGPRPPADEKDSDKGDRK